MLDATNEEKRTAALAAYSKAWASVRNPELDGVNPHFRNRYATLVSTLNAVRAACAGQGLAYMQAVERDDTGATLASYIVDSEGTAVELSRYRLAEGRTPQEFGSALTYTKRQQAQADWGITGEEDDDGEAASAPRRDSREKATRPATRATLDKLGTRVAEFAEKAGKDVSEAYTAICESKAVKATGYDGGPDMTERQALAALGIAEAWVRKVEERRAAALDAIEGARLDG